MDCFVRNFGLKGFCGKKMFWRERERENKEQNGGPPCGQVRVLVVGDSGMLIFFFFFVLPIFISVYFCRFLLTLICAFVSYNMYLSLFGVCFIGLLGFS